MYVPPCFFFVRCSPLLLFGVDVQRVTLPCLPYVSVLIFCRATQHEEPTFPASLLYANSDKAPVAKTSDAADDDAACGESGPAKVRTVCKHKILCWNK